MAISDLILKALELDAKTKALNSDIREADTDATQIKDALLEAVEIKEGVLLGKSEAKSEVEKAEERVDSAKAGVKDAERGLVEAVAFLASSEEELREYNDEAMAELNTGIDNLQADLLKALAKKEEKIESSVATQAELKEVQNTLREQGYEFSVGAPKPKSRTVRM